MPEYQFAATLWVAADDEPAARERIAEGQTRDVPGKVIAATAESVTVRFRFDEGERDLTFDRPLPRIRWRRQNGRAARWSYV